MDDRHAEELVNLLRDFLYDLENKVVYSLEQQVSVMMDIENDLGTLTGNINQISETLSELSTSMFTLTDRIDELNELVAYFDDFVKEIREEKR